MRLDASDSPQIGWFSMGINRSLGCGSDILFWNDKWEGVEPLENLFAGIMTNRLSKKHWRLFWFDNIWSLWLHNNDIIFKEGKIDFDKVFVMIRINSWSWCSAANNGNYFTFVDWCLNPTCCLESFSGVTN